MPTFPKDPRASAIDWNEMAKTFDRWLPYIRPVAERLLSLADLAEGQEVLDVAAGTGEPSLTIARRFGAKIRITAVDGAEGMVAAAEEKRKREQLAGVTFQQMKAESLLFPTEYFDRVISRFGVMLFDDPLQGLKEMRRVLKTGGRVTIAVWGDLDEIDSVYLIWKIITEHLPPEEALPTPKMTDLGPPGKLKGLLQAAGFNAFEIIPLPIVYPFDDFESYWKISTESGTLREPLDRFSLVEQEEIKRAVFDQTAPFRKNGKVVFENRALLATALK